jgi:PadR family transcriptional regulator, regulatory protein AphA
MLKYILLGFIDYGPMTGYELKQTIDVSTGFFWHAHHSQIYTTLRQMEKEGLVSSEFKNADDSLRRRVYFLTPEGQNVLKKWLDTPMKEVSQVKEDFLVRIFFSGKRDPKKVLGELKEHRRLHEETMENYEHIKNCIPDHGHPEMNNKDGNQKFWNLTLEMGFLYEKMYIEWLDIAIQTVESI